MKFLYNLFFGVILNGATLYGLIYFVPEVTYTGGWKFFVVGGVVMGFLNFFIKPLLKILSLPFIILTAGLFSIVINAFLLWFLSYLLKVAAFQDVLINFPNIGSYVIGAIVFGLINWLVNLFFK